MDVARKMLELEERLDGADLGWVPSAELKDMLKQANAIQKLVDNAKFRITRSGRLRFESKDNITQLKLRARQLVRQADDLVRNREVQIQQVVGNLAMMTS